MARSFKPTVFVAGATGAVGKPLCKLLVADGWRVVGTTRSTAKVSLLLELGVEPVVVDVLDAQAVAQAVLTAKPEVIMHQLTDLPAGLDAAQMPAALQQNAHLRDVGTRNLVGGALAAGARRFVAQSVSFANVPAPSPYDEKVALNVDAPGLTGISARGVASLEAQVLACPMDSVILRYGRLYGPGTGFDTPPSESPLHVDAAADAARRAMTFGNGIYNVSENDGILDLTRIHQDLKWDAGFRLPQAH